MGEKGEIFFLSKNKTDYFVGKHKKFWYNKK